MAFRSDVSVDWSASPRIIEVAAPSTSITIQDLWDTCRQLEAALGELDDDFLIHPSSGGKISAGTYTIVITLVLNDALLKFEARGTPTICIVSEGIFAAVDENGDPVDPRAFSTNTNVDISQTISGSINQLDLNDLRYRVEDLRLSHGGYGDTVYWDPWNGDDDSNGEDPGSPVLTWTRAHTLARAEYGDIIQLLPSGTHGSTITTPITLSKNHVHLRGSVDTTFVTPGETAVTVTGDKCSVSTVLVQNSDIGFYSTGTDVLFRQCSAQTNSTDFSCGGLATQLQECHSNLSTVGVEALASSDGMRLRKCVVYGCGTGVLARAGAAKTCLCDGSVVNACTSYGVKLETGSTGSALIDCSVIGNATNLLDEGTGTVRDTRISHSETLLSEISSIAASIAALASTVDTNQQLILQLREGNIQRSFVSATVAVPSRNVDVGVLDYIDIEVKNDGDADWGSPASTKRLYCTYATMGDTNPIKVGGTP